MWPLFIRPRFCFVKMSITPDIWSWIICMGKKSSNAVKSCVVIMISLRKKRFDVWVVTVGNLFEGDRNMFSPNLEGTIYRLFRLLLPYFRSEVSDSEKCKMSI